MPTTLNGIGTRYCFKSNQVKRAGECTHCGRTGNLASYDAGLWFTVLFIPIFPLGRKRILDQCPLCTRHHVLDLDEWETSKQNAISGALQKYRANPTPDAGMAAYQQLLNFHQYEQAAELRQSLSERFAENATLQAYLGLTLQDMGKVDEADRFFARALEINPDLPHARVGVANLHMRAGRLDDARRLLDFLEKPDAAQRYSLAPLENLAVAYQTAGKHRAALELLGLMRQALPEADQNRAFRKLVRKSEKALWHPNTMLGKKRFNWREFLGARDRSWAGAGPAIQTKAQHILLAIVLISGLIVALVLGIGGYERGRRKLLVVNAYTQPATVTIPGVGSYPAPPGVSTIVLKEGTHHASITGPVRQEVDFELRSRHFYNAPAWVLNINGRALLALESVNYGRDAAPGGMSVHFGETFTYFLGVAYLFEPPPRTMQVPSGGTRTVLSLDFLRRPPLEVYQYLISRKDPATAVRLAEWRLTAEPDDEEMLDTYVGAQEDKAYQARVENFLRAGLTNRPVAMDWHRTYQMLRPDRQRDAQLATDYEAALRLDPTNSALLYLRGRLATGAGRRTPGTFMRGTRWVTTTWWRATGRAPASFTRKW